MVVSSFLEHGRCLRTMSILPPLLLWQHLVGGLAPNMVWCLLAFWYHCLFVKVLHGHMCNFLVIEEELIFMRKYCWCQMLPLHFLGLDGFSSRLISFLKYARCLNKSYYWHLIFEFWLRFFFLKILHQIIFIKFEFMFWTENSCFLRPEELLRLFANLLAFFVFKFFLAKLLCSCDWKDILMRSTTFS
jgi:hypothetical protein